MDSEELCYQLRDTKSSGGEITRMVWSPKMDLIVAALADNSVCFFRLLIHANLDTKFLGLTLCPFFVVYV